MRRFGKQTKQLKDINKLSSTECPVNAHPCLPSDMFSLILSTKYISMLISSCFADYTQIIETRFISDQDGHGGV